MRNKQKILALAIIVMGVLTIALISILLFVPRTPEQLISKSRRNLTMLMGYSETISADTELTLSKDDVEGLKEIGTDQITVPVNITIRAEIMPEDRREHAHRETSYTVFDEVISIESEAYIDHAENTMYLNREDNWNKSEPSVQTLDIRELLDLAEDDLDGATMEKAGGKYYLTVEATGIDADLAMPFMRSDEEMAITGGKIIYTFDGWNKRLESIETADLMICDASAVGTTDQSTHEKNLDLMMTFEGFDEITPDDVTAPDEVVKAAEESDKDTSESGNAYTLSIEDLTGKAKTSYTVGEDVPPGKYIVKRKSGSGIFKVLSGDDAKVKLNLRSGYDYYKIDNLDKGEEVTLDEDDKILLSGEEFTVVIEPAE